MKKNKDIDKNEKLNKKIDKNIFIYNLKLYFSIFFKYIYILVFILFIYFFASKIRYQKFKDKIEEGIIINFNMSEEKKYILVDLLNSYLDIKNKENNSLDEKNKEDIFKKFGIEKSIYKNENIYKDAFIKDISLFFTIFILIYFLYIYLIYKKEITNLKEIKNIRKIIEESLNGKVYFNYIDCSENEKSKEKSLINKDITKIIRTKEEEEKDKKNIEEFISDMAHQLRIPISNINLQIFMLKKENLEKHKDKIKEIELEINKISFLIEELLKMARLDSKTIEFKKEEVKYNDFIENILEKFKYMIELKEVEIDFEKSGGTLYIDNFWSEEAVSNILKNAIEHNKNGGKIYISFLETPLYKRINIKDEGEGMEKNEIKNIFKRFYKGKNASKKSIGIGINIAKKIVEEQGGFIEVKSEIGKGSEFRINFVK